ncbi:hypothetical protein M5K25_004000 [Dendrobium thyrsiflorum]|uniref:Uncharacterized protein n=1 Tax=Dendrobium thyrsiflorum TaxID=117978 RepID=A0ABD0VKN9_DENTH
MASWPILMTFPLNNLMFKNNPTKKLLNVIHKIQRNLKKTPEKGVNMFCFEIWKHFSDKILLKLRLSINTAIIRIGGFVKTVRSRDKVASVQRKDPSWKHSTQVNINIQKIYHFDFTQFSHFEPYALRLTRLMNEKRLNTQLRNFKHRVDSIADKRD